MAKRNSVIVAMLVLALLVAGIAVYQKRGAFFANVGASQLFCADVDGSDAGTANAAIELSIPASPPGTPLSSLTTVTVHGPTTLSLNFSNGLTIEVTLYPDYAVNMRRGGAEPQPGNKPYQHYESIAPVSSSGSSAAAAGFSVSSAYSFSPGTKFSSGGCSTPPFGVYKNSNNEDIELNLTIPGPLVPVNDLLVPRPKVLVDPSSGYVPGANGNPPLPEVRPYSDDPNNYPSGQTRIMYNLKLTASAARSF